MGTYSVLIIVFFNDISPIRTLRAEPLEKKIGKDRKKNTEDKYEGILAPHPLLYKI